MPHESERLRGDAAIRERGLAGSTVTYQGRQWLIMETVEEGRAVRLYQPETGQEKIMPVGEIQGWGTVS